MIVINLLPKEERVEERVLTAAPRAKFLFPVLAILVLAVPPIATHVVQEVRLHTLKREMQVVEQESQSLQPRIDLVREIAAKRLELEGQLDLVGRLNRDRTLPVRLLDELAAQIPEHLWLTKMEQIGGSQLNLEGATFSNLIVADLMNRLAETKLYDGVDLTVAAREQIGEAQVITFTLTAGIKDHR